MDTEALIDRIRSLRDRVDAPASPTKPPIFQPAATPDQELSQHNADDIIDTAPPEKTDQHPHDRTASIANNLSDAMASLNEDVYDVYANKSDVTALETRMQMIEQKLHKTQDMIVTLNRAVGRLIDYEENHNKALPDPEPEHNPEDVKEPEPEAAPVIVLDRVASDRMIANPSPPDHGTNQHATPRRKSDQRKSYQSLWFGAAAMMLVLIYFMLAPSTTTSQPTSSLPESDTFLNENEMAVYAYIEMGMARPLGITSLDQFSARMWEKGIDLPQYYECLVSILDASTRPMNQMMLIELLDNPLRSDYNPAIIDRQRAMFEGRYGSADHYGGYNRARTNIETCRNW